ncbi:MAG: dihydrolipoamide acetyltransferase [Deltaproteobacteria bacterium]|nr:dihydrolipoamide acetyltransferase [Deltaproteobacteria bacterium]
MKKWLLVALPVVVAAASARAQEPPAAPAPGAAAAPAEGAGAPGTPPASASAGYDIRLKSLQERVDDLKSRVFDSKTKLLLLREQILHNLIAEARAVIVHVNDASAALTLEEALYYLDNEKIYYQSNRDGLLDSKKEIAIYNGTIGPGNHLLSVELVYRGNGKVFTYLSGYVFRIKSSFSFYAAKGQETRVKSVGYEKGGMTTRLEERPSVRFEMQQRKVQTAEPSPGAPAQPATP